MQVLQAKSGARRNDQFVYYSSYAVSPYKQFGAIRESHIRDRLVHGIRDDMERHKLVGKKDLTLAKFFEILRTSQVHQIVQRDISE